MVVKAQFILHQIGALVMVVALYLCTIPDMYQKQLSTRFWHRFELSVDLPFLLTMNFSIR
ncbi:hypothetical protein J3998_11320 [Thiomicrorhabdus sp. 6S2-11]|uniref:Uncharacterized protein n=1 Tax=Thiomicrorhabdus marina TaxID=2818442 RepID=A0ABS3Q8M4_9GAMM|nr:hypothetical protein [Thiomicrorhabdus marina]MBO1928165.1 hypothetical protein [Thiomicrorhabdus marina]